MDEEFPMEAVFADFRQLLSSQVDLEEISLLAGESVGQTESD